MPSMRSSLKRRELTIGFGLLEIQGPTIKALFQPGPGIHKPITVFTALFCIIDWILLSLYYLLLDCCAFFHHHFFNYLHFAFNAMNITSNAKLDFLEG